MRDREQGVRDWVSMVDKMGYRVIDNVGRLKGGCVIVCIDRVCRDVRYLHVQGSSLGSPDVPPSDPSHWHSHAVGTK